MGSLFSSGHKFLIFPSIYVFAAVVAGVAVVLVALVYLSLYFVRRRRQRKTDPFVERLIPGNVLEVDEEERHSLTVSRTLGVDELVTHGRPIARKKIETSRSIPAALRVSLPTRTQAPPLAHIPLSSFKPRPASRLIPPPFHTPIHDKSKKDLINLPPQHGHSSSFGGNNIIGAHSQSDYFYSKNY